MGNKKYPCLKKFILNDPAQDTIVLFTSPGRGTVIVSDFYPLGHKATNWTESSDPDEWVAIKGIKETE